MNYIINEYLHLTGSVAAYIKIVDIKNHTLTCTKDGVHFFDLPDDMTDLYSIPINEVQLVRAGFKELIYNNVIATSGKVFFITTGKGIPVYMLLESGHWNLLININGNDNKISDVDNFSDLQHNVFILLRETLQLDLVDTIINRQILHDEISQTYQKQYFVAGSTSNGISNASLRLGYIHFDQIFLSEYNDHCHHIVTISNFSGKTADVVIETTYSLFKYNSKDSMDNVVKSIDYQKLSNDEQTFIYDLYQKLGHCFQKSLKC